MTRVGSPPAPQKHDNSSCLDRSPLHLKTPTAVHRDAIQQSNGLGPYRLINRVTQCVPHRLVCVTNAYESHANYSAVKIAITLDDSNSASVIHGQGEATSVGRDGAVRVGRVGWNDVHWPRSR